MINYFDKLEEYDVVINESINKTYCIDNISNNIWVEEDMLVCGDKFSWFENILCFFGYYPVVIYYEINPYNVHEEKNLIISSRSSFCKKMRKL